jgi:hypothetical protein
VGHLLARRYHVALTYSYTTARPSHPRSPPSPHHGEVPAVGGRSIPGQSRRSVRWCRYCARGALGITCQSWRLRLGTIPPACAFSSGGIWKEPVHEPNCFFRSARLRHRRPPRVVCERPVPEPRDNRSGFLGGGISAGYSRGTISSAPKHNPRSGAWRKYSTSAIGHRASFSVDTRSAIDIGVRFEIAIEEMIAGRAGRPAGNDNEPSPRVSGDSKSADRYDTAVLILDGPFPLSMPHHRTERTGMARR